MSFTRPTLQQIKDRVEADFKTGLSLSTVLSRSFIKVFALAISGASHVLHGFVSWALRQFFTDTSDEAYLVRDARIFGVERKEASFAEIEIEITGTDGVPVPGRDSVPGPAARFQRSDGFEYEVKAEVTPSGGTVLATLVALTPGDVGNVADGSTLSLTSPISGIVSDAIVQQTLIEGEAQETVEQLRTRLLERKRNPPAGGTVADYIQFAKTVPGVTRVWVFPGWLGQGTVAVSFVEDNENPIIPSPAKVDEVQAAILELCPIEADATAFAPVATPINPTIRITPNTQAVRDAVTAELEDLIFREAQVRGAIDPARVADGISFTGILPISKIREAISVAAGEDDHELVSPTESPQPFEGGLLTLGTITFQTLV